MKWGVNMTFNSKALTGAKLSGFNMPAVGSRINALYETSSPAPHVSELNGGQVRAENAITTVLKLVSINLKGDIWLRKDKNGKEIITLTTAAVYNELTVAAGFTFETGNQAKVWLVMKDSGKKEYKSVLFFYPPFYLRELLSQPLAGNFAVVQAVGFHPREQVPCASLLGQSLLQGLGVGYRIV
jgi:hypothetical protein